MFFGHIPCFLHFFFMRLVEASCLERGMDLWVHEGPYAGLLLGGGNYEQVEQ